MPIDDPTEGMRLIFRSKKHHNNNPSRPWYNTYEAKVIADTTFGNLISAAQNILGFERQLCGSFVIFDQVEVSTWEPDSDPYDPSTFFIFDALQLPGTRNITTPIDLEICLWLRRQVTTGRQGKLFLRGALDGAEIESPAGQSVLSDPAAVEGRVSDAVIDHLITHILGGSSDVRLMMINKNGSNERGVVTLSPAGVRSVNMNHRWFNRPTPETP